MIEFLATTEPQSLLAFALLAFAAGMYPLGFMFGFPCSPCCLPRAGTPCESCGLPDTCTVTFSGMPVYPDSHGPWHLLLEFHADTPGFEPGGGYGFATGPIGTIDDAGPITGAIVADGGSGYASFGRAAPLATIASPGGGSQLTPVWEIVGQDPAGRDLWGVTSVTIDAPGTAIPDAGSLILVEKSGDIQYANPLEASIEAYLFHAVPVIAFAEPDITAKAPTGSGAVLAVEVSEITGLDPQHRRWQVDSVSVTSGGAGYVNGAAVAFSFAANDFFEVLPTATIQVNGNGSITDVTVTQGGQSYKSNGIASVSILNSGKMYRIDKTAEPYVADVYVTLDQTVQPIGHGATFSVTVDSDPDSPTFGSVVGITVDDGGDGYLAAHTVRKCCDFWEEQPYVLNRGGAPIGQASEACTFAHEPCGDGGEQGKVTVEFGAVGTRPRVYLQSGVGSQCTMQFIADAPVPDCSNFSFAATADNGATVTVESGGEYDAEGQYKGPCSCHVCCQGDEEIPEEVEATVTLYYTAFNGFFNDVTYESVTFDATFSLECPNSSGMRWFLEIPADSDAYAAIAADILLLSNDAQYNIYTPLANNRGPGGSWGGPNPWPLPTFEIKIQPCDEKNSTGWTGESPSGECANCHRTCYTVVTGNPGFVGGGSHTTGFECDLCETTPMCGPKAGTYDPNYIDDANYATPQMIKLFTVEIQ